ncbi:allantoate deiminase 2 [Telopea speciosissima]|uniref:allantoate deiminase 2 n=1 Tax=Telopea speciosissima TaxID=54955 RepID=UPI001CC71EBA|nr:allantoate deiminase 2 [Telopea speciosissima]
MASRRRKADVCVSRNSKAVITFGVSLVLSWFLVFSMVSATSLAYSSAGTGMGDSDSCRSDLYPEILRDEAVARLNELGKVSDADGYLERTFLSPASTRAGKLIQSWMEDAGLRTWMDQMGNIHGRTDGMNASAEALLVGSHMDTVIDAGIYDGSLGIVCAVSALKVMKITGNIEKLKRPVEVIAFSDEEGVRFQSTFLGSAAIAGILPASVMQISDKSGVTVQDVLKENSIEVTEESFLQLKYDPQSVWGYIEVHIEQGPVLESLGLPLAVVKGIAGQTRLKVTVSGAQGHAGTVPMAMRRDPMAAAAELIGLLESICKDPESYLSYDGHCNGFTADSLAGSLVCTVGEISSWPSASNVIPGQVIYTIDLRAMEDMAREAIIFELANQMYRICDRRSVACIIERKHDAGAIVCDPGLSSKMKSAAYSAVKKMVGEVKDEVPVLMSGAGHDAMAMSHLTEVGMLFVRCRGGISHSPAEHVLEDDIWAAGLAVLEFLDQHVT